MIIDLEYHDKENRLCRIYDFQMGDKYCDIDNPILISFSLTNQPQSIKIHVFIPLDISPELKDGAYFDAEYENTNNKYWDNINLVKDIVLVNGFNFPNFSANFYYFDIRVRAVYREGIPHTRCRFILYSDIDHINEIWNGELSPYYLFVKYGATNGY